MDVEPENVEYDLFKAPQYVDFVELVKNYENNSYYEPMDDDADSFFGIIRTYNDATIATEEVDIQAQDVTEESSENQMETKIAENLKRNSEREETLELKFEHKHGNIKNHTTITTDTEMDEKSVKIHDKEEELRIPSAFEAENGIDGATEDQQEIKIISTVETEHQENVHVEFKKLENMLQLQVQSSIKVENVTSKINPKLTFRIPRVVRSQSQSGMLLHPPTPKISYGKRFSLEKYTGNTKRLKIETETEKSPVGPVPLLVVLPSIKPVKLFHSSQNQNHDHQTKEHTNIKFSTLSKQMKEKWTKLQELRKQDKVKKEEHQNKLVQIVRQKSVHHAKPVPKPRVFNIRLSQKPLTVPKSPSFQLLPSQRRLSKKCEITLKKQ